MKILNYLMILNFLVFVSCSKGDKDISEYEDDDIELVDGEEDDGDLELDEDEEVEIVDSEDEDFADGEEDEEFLDDEGEVVASIDEDGIDDEFNEEFSDPDGEFMIASSSDEDIDDEFESDDEDIEIADDSSDELELDDPEDGDLLGEEPAVEVADDSMDDIAIDEPTEEVAISDDMSSEGPEIASTETQSYADTTSDLPAASYDAPAASPDYSSVAVPNDANGVYTVQNNETLMLVAYKIYGDYSRWKEIAAINAGALGGGTSVSNGMQLRYSDRGAGFNPGNRGTPYLIQRGDTLGLISKSVYGATNRWKEIWNNNREMIKDPNLIFAGFTLYYQNGQAPAPQRELSSVEPAAQAPAAIAPAAPEAPADDFMEDEAIESDLSLEDDFPEDL